LIGTVRGNASVSSAAGRSTDPIQTSPTRSCRLGECSGTACRSNGAITCEPPSLALGSSGSSRCSAAPIRCPETSVKLERPSRLSTDDQVRISSRVLGDIGTDGLKVPKRLRGPEDRRHTPSRRLTSSCEIPLPSSSSARPASILARNTSRSMASSKVASGGKSWSASRIRSRVVGVVIS